MKKNDSLYQLIRSLTRGEKRNFRLLAKLTGGEDKKYIKLFDVMERAEEYDEEKVLRHFKKDPAFVRQFSVNKNYLYQSILNSLSYHRKSTDAELSSQALQLKILIEKNLFSHATRMIRKVKEKIERSERFDELFTILNLEVDLARRAGNMKLLPRIIKDVAFQEKLILEKLENLMAYRQLERETALLTRVQTVARNVKEISAAEDYYSHPLLIDEGCALSVKAKLLFLEINRRLADYKGDLLKVIEIGKKAIQLYEKYPYILQDDKLNYILRLGILTKSFFLIDDDEEGFLHMAKMRNLETDTPQQRVTRFEFGTLIHLALYSYRGDKEGGIEFIPVVEKDMEALGKEISESPRFMAYYFCASFYITIGDYSSALKWINLFLNTCESSFRTDLQSMIRILNLLVHFELGNKDLVEYSLKSTYRFVYKKERMYKYERRILSFFTDVLKVRNRQEYLDKALVLKQDLLEIIKDPYEKWATNLFDMPMWLDAIFEGLTISDLRKRAFEKRKAAKVAELS